jgi:hypothetical protein
MVSVGVESLIATRYLLIALIYLYDDAFLNSSDVYRSKYLFEARLVVLLYCGVVTECRHFL